MAAMTVLGQMSGDRNGPSIGSNDSAMQAGIHDSVLEEAFGERAALMEYDGGLSRGEAERAAWSLVMQVARLN